MEKKKFAQKRRVKLEKLSKKAREADSKIQVYLSYILHIQQIHFISKPSGSNKKCGDISFAGNHGNQSNLEVLPGKRRQ